MSNALINRSLANVRTELDFLLENKVISKEFYNEFTTRLPQRWDNNSSIVSNNGYNTSQMQLAEVIYSYEPQQAGDLRLQVGDKVEILQVLSESWYKGRHKGESGVFPANYVRRMDMGQESRPLMPVPLTTTTNNNNMFMDLPSDSFAQQDQVPPYSPPQQYAEEKQRQEEQRLQREREEKQKRDEEEQRRRREEDDRRRQEEEERRRRQEEEERRRREDEERRRREEEQRIQQQQFQQMQIQQQQQQQMQQQQMQQQQQQMQQQQYNKHHNSFLHQFGTSLGNAVVWGAGSRIGSDLVNSAFNKLHDRDDDN